MKRDVPLVLETKPTPAPHARERIRRMSKPTPIHPIDGDSTAQDVLTTILREGAQQLLAAALEDEVARHIAMYADERDEEGRRMVVRNGHCPEREIQTGVGAVKVARPRINDRRTDGNGERMIFSSSILPPYLRRTKSMEELIPWLYLKGVSTGDFGEALQALVGAGAPGLSASTVTRLKQGWEKDHEDWSRRDLSEKRYVYLWVDGIHFNIRLEEDRQCILVVMGATEDGKKELIAVQDGYRESEQSWRELLLDLKSRGLEVDPMLAIGDGALGFWKALPQVWPKTRRQRCWVHKLANILNKLPKRLQAHAKALIRRIWMAATREAAEKAFDLFLKTYEDKHPGAATCLEKDRDDLLAFYDFPAAHWRHIRTTNPIESTFATVRLRTKRTKGSGSRTACLAMVFKLCQAAERKWRKLNGHEQLAEVIRGVNFEDGIKMAAKEEAA